MNAQSDIRLLKLRRRPYFRFALRLAAVAWARYTGRSVVPYKAIVEVTRHCNAPCKHCNISRQPRNPDELSTEELSKSISSLGTNLFWLNITGGEPTLRADLPIIVRKAVVACPNLFLINIPLNGRIPERTAETVNRLVTENPEVLFHVTLSMDGMKSLQDELRGRNQWIRTQASWEKLSTIRQHHTNLRLSMQSTISAANAHQAVEMLYAYANISDTYAIAFATESQFYGNQGAGVAFTGGMPGATQVVKDLARLYPIQLTKPETIFVKMFLYGQLRRLISPKTSIPCSAGSATVTLKADGSVRPCLFLDDEDIGNVRYNNYDIPSIISAERAERSRKLVATCSRCWINCEAIPSMIASPLRMLSLLREGWKGKRKFPLLP